jgi:hypothetical protein
MILLAVDPGSTDTAFIRYDTPLRKVLEHQRLPNAMVEDHLNKIAYGYGADHLIIEYPFPRGQPMYTQLVDTIYWIGRFAKAWNKEWEKMDRKDVKMTLCRSAKANDSQIRAAIISRYPATGGGAIGQIGTKALPGPLYGISADKWAALAVAITYSIKHGLEPDTIGLPF